MPIIHSRKALSTVCLMVLLLLGRALAQAPQISLHQAAFQGRIDLVRQLIQAGADVNDTSNTLHLSALHCTMIDLNARPLTAVDKKTSTEIAFLLLDSGADVNARSKNGNTPLYLASFYGYSEIALRLIKKGVNLEFGNSELGTTPLQVVAAQGQPEIVNLLLKAGAKIQSRDKQGNTALHRIAVSTLNLNKQAVLQQVVLLLLNNGLDINSRNSAGQTPLGLAKAFRQEAMAKFLQEHGGKE